MCPANGESPEAPVIAITDCMICKRRKAQPEIGICRPCERHSYSVSDLLGLALIVAVLGLFTSCCGPSKTIVRQRDEIAALKEDVRILDGLYERSQNTRWRCGDAQEDGMDADAEKAARETDEMLREGWVRP